MSGYLAVDLRGLQSLPDGEPILVLAQEILDDASAVVQTIESADSKWQALGSVYSAPEQELVLRALEAPAAHSAEYAAGTRELCTALTRFGRDLMSLHARRRTLEADIEAAGRYLADELRGIQREGASPWAAEAVLAAARGPLQAVANHLFVSFEQARTECLAALAGISRTTRDVVATFPSDRLDVSSALRGDMEKALGRAAAPDAAPEDIRAFYAQLLLLGPELLRELGRRPEARMFLPGLSPHEEANFWSALNGPQQKALAAAFPALVGNLEGAPYAVRDAANRRVLAAVHRELDRAPAGSFAAAGDDLHAAQLRQLERRQAVAALLAALEASPAEESRQLISFDPGPGVPLAAISVGDLDTAANISFLVPGMNTAAKSARTLVGEAQALGREQSRTGVHGNSTAVVAYMGYKPPTEATVGGMASAEKGAPAFAAALDGLYLARTADSSADGAPAPEVNVVAHSYGTTMATLALDQTQYRVSTAVLLASAGVQPGSAEHLNVDLATDGAVDVYVTLASEDHLAELGISASQIVAFVTLDPDAARLNPVAETWGGRIFSSDQVTVDGRSFAAVGGHGLSSYLGEGSFSLYFTALVTAGRAEEALALMAAGKEDSSAPPAASSRAPGRALH